MGTAASAAHVTSRMRSCLRIFPPLVIRVPGFASRLPGSILPIAYVQAAISSFSSRTTRATPCQEWCPLDLRLRPEVRFWEALCGAYHQLRADDGVLGKNVRARWPHRGMARSRKEIVISKPVREPHL